MTYALAKRIGAAALVSLVALLVLGVVVFGLMRLFPRADPIPAQVARKDEKAAAAISADIGEQVRQQNQGATIHLDVITKDINDAFDRLPAPAPSPAAGEPRAIPAAPIDGLRDRLNEGAARANRAAGAAAPRP